MTFDRDKMKSDSVALAAAGVFPGTSSRKYPGWLEQLYTRDRYVWRGRYAASRFDRDCLTEHGCDWKWRSRAAAVTRSAGICAGVFSLVTTRRQRCRRSQSPSLGAATSSRTVRIRREGVTH